VAVSTIVQVVNVDGKTAQGAQLKWSSGWCTIISAPKGVITCGAIDVKTLQEFNIVAARVKGTPKVPINNIDDLLKGKITEVNGGAKSLGIKAGMLAQDALKMLF